MIKNWISNKRVQTLIGVIPIFMVWVFVGIYLYGVCQQYAYYGYNDKLMVQSYNQNNIVKIDSIDESQDGSYRVHLTQGDDMEEFDIKTGDLIYQLERIEDNWFRYYVNGNYIYTTMPVLVTSSSKSDDKIIVNTREFKISELAGNVVYSVYLNDDGEYHIEYADGSTQDVSTLPNVSTVLSSDNGYRVQVTASKEKDVVIRDAITVFSLPTDDAYMELSSSTLIKNISKDYWKLELTSSKYQFIAIAFFVLTVFIVYNKFTKRMTELAKTRYVVMYIITSVLILLGVLFTYVMLSNNF